MGCSWKVEKRTSLCPPGGQDQGTVAVYLLGGGGEYSGDPGGMPFIF